MNNEIKISEIRDDNIDKYIKFKLKMSIIVSIKKNQSLLDVVNMIFK